MGVNSQNNEVDIGNISQEISGQQRPEREENTSNARSREKCLPGRRKGKQWAETGSGCYVLGAAEL